MYRKLMQLLRHSALYGLGSMSGKLLAIVLVPLYTHYLSVPEYGAVETVLAIDLLFSAIVRLGLQNSLMRFFFDGEREGGRGHVVVQTVFWATTVSTTVGALALGLAAGPIAAQFLGGADQANLVWIGAFGVWSSAVYGTMTSTFRLLKQPVRFFQVSLANVVLTAVFTVGAVVFLRMGAEGLLGGPFLATFVLIPVTMALQPRFVGWHFDRALLKRMVRFGVPTMPIGVANQGLRMVDRLILTKVAGLGAVGLYGLASRAAQVVMLVVLALQLSWQPFAYSIEDDDEARETYAYVMTYFVAGIGWMVAGSALLADPVVRLAVRPAYYDAATALPLLALAAGIYGMYFIAGIGASRVKRTEFHVVVAAGALAVSIAANLALAPRYGMMGSAVASVLANGALSLFMFMRSQHVFHVPYHWRRIATAGLVVCASIAVAYALPGGQTWTLAPRLVLALGFPVWLLALGFFPARERAAIARRVRRRVRRAPAGSHA